MIVDIRDQLGNQLFTYASTKSICIETGQDFQWFTNGTTIVNSYDKKLGNTIDGGAFPNVDLSERVLPVMQPKYDWVEPWPRTSNYLPEVYQMNPYALVRGHFQCERYFAAYRQEVLHWFRLNDSLIEKSTQQMKMIQQQYPDCKTVSVHMRLGWDYLREGRLLREDYYIKGIRCIAEMTGMSVEKLIAVVFSDVKVDEKVLSKLQCRPVLARGTLFDDFALMQLCDYHIVSNSTFAWWGAWLDEKKTLVIRPSVYPVSGCEYYPDDIFPDRWISVDAIRVKKPLTVLVGRIQRKVRR